MNTEELVCAQRAYFETGATRPLEFRLAQLRKLQRALQDNEALLESAMYSDFRKAPMEVYMCETGIVLEEVRFHLKHLRSWMRERAVPTPLAQFHAKSFVSPEPYGVALIIAPWNYPVQLCLSPLVGAISGGNCAVLKPSAYAPATSAAIAEIIAQTFEPQYIAVIEGGRAENSALLAQRFDTIFFTGSVAVGKVVMEAAAKHLTPVTLELGGKSPVIVDETADIAQAAKDIVDGASFDNNVLCVAEKEVFMVNSIADSLMNTMEKCGAYRVYGEDIDKIVRTVLIQKDGKYVINRKFVGHDATYILRESGVQFSGDPVLVIADVDRYHPFVEVEMLMPVLGMVRVNNFDEALDEAFRAEHGCQHSAMIHSSNVHNMSRAARRMNTTIFVKNAPSYSGLGFGGEGYTTLTIATPTGEGLTSAKSFTRARRCVLKGDFRII